MARLAFTLAGVGAGLAFRGINRIHIWIVGESDLEYLRRKHSELVVRTWPID